MKSSNLSLCLRRSKMRTERYIEYIQIAKQIVLDAKLNNLGFQQVAFEIVLKHLIENDKDDIDYDSEIAKRLESARESSRED
jgi:hypothetical protein